MLIARADGHDRSVLFIGLSEANVSRLQDGQPIHISRATHGMAVPEHLTILIAVGETEQAIADELTRLGAIGPTTVRDQRWPA